MFRYLMHPVAVLWLSLGLVFGVAACTPGKPSATADTGMYAIKSAYAVAQKGAIAYARLPRCSVAVKLPCSEQATVDSLVQLDDRATAALKQATVTVDLLSIMLEFSSTVSKAQLEARP